GKDMLVHSPIFFLAQDREIAEEAEPGDIIGIPNHGTVRVGDTFTEGEDLRFTGLPVFAPELLRRVLLSDATRSKQLRKALEDLAEEGLVQVFRPNVGAHWIIGVVGTLQLDVMMSRAKQEYKIDIRVESMPYTVAVWLRSDNETALNNFIKYHSNETVRDRYDNPVFLAKSAWELDYKVQKNEEIEFLKTREL
ncbi:MAG: peptide chain release factor 3, partial [Rhizobiales bacterium]|nr:peptide chain release factor 3 [Hyphomicrobiales bacterium]